MEVSDLSFNCASTKVILIGIGNYDNDDFATILPAKSNLDELSQIFLDKRFIGIKQENLIVLYDENHDIIMEKILRILKSDIDTVIIYYIGHGHRTNFNKLYLTAKNTSKELCKYTGIDFDSLKSDLDASAVSKKILILDSCYSGITTLSEPEITSHFENNISGLYILSSSPPNEVSLYDNASQFTFFTGELIKTLRKGLDIKREFLSLDEIYNSLKKELVRKKFPEPRRKDNLNDANFYFSKNLSFNIQQRYVKAEELILLNELKSAKNEYEKLNDLISEEYTKLTKEEIKNKIEFIQNIIEGDSKYKNNSFQDAFQFYQNALNIQDSKQVLSKLEECKNRIDSEKLKHEKNIDNNNKFITGFSDQPFFKSITINQQLPNKLLPLKEISNNLWWTWDDDAQELFETIDPEIWKSTDNNPFLLFDNVNRRRLIQLSEDRSYIQKLIATYNRFNIYMEGKKDLKPPLIAFFSMEYGIHDCLKLYSGGLGILAGDYLKEASDACMNVVGIGLFYRYGYFSQVITNKGEQQANYDYQHLSKLPIHPVRDENSDFATIQVMLPGRPIFARVWYIEVGRIRLYLLDSDIDMNSPEDRSVSHQLYGGDNENRLKQELLLGVGGIRALSMLNIVPDLYHNNEGHSAFINLERVRMLMRDEQLTYSEAKEKVRCTTLFTTHTPVPAGHDHFDEDLLRVYLGHYPARMRISWEEFMALGRANPNDWSEKFNMSYLAAHMAQEVNGVSMLHGEVIKDMFVNLWPGYLAQELHVNYVTNGVHWSTWTSPEWKDVYKEIFDNNFTNRQLDFKNWEKIYSVDDKRIWDIKQTLRTRLIHSVKDRFKESWTKRHEDPKHIVAIINILSEKALTIVFARRFATYKRAHLLFRNIERLAKLVNNPDRPVQFIFAGKAHPNDKAGQDLIKMIVEISKRPEFLGKILFIQNYSIGLAKLLVSGADVWLNTPTRPLEASGTSGEKAVMNGTLLFSVLDGWWVEGYRPEAGWALTNERTYENPEFQDDLDVEIIYQIFENEIIPAFYNRDKDGVPNDWIRYIKNSVAQIASRFTARRMINDYFNKYYINQYKRSIDLTSNNNFKLKEITLWKEMITGNWTLIEVIEANLAEKTSENIESNYNNYGQVVLRLNEIQAEHIGVELVIVENYNELVSRQEFICEEIKDNLTLFSIEFNIDKPGTYKCGIRIFPKHELLPHRQDFSLMKWIWNN